jgi:hypothetical protein
MKHFLIACVVVSSTSLSSMRVGAQDAIATTPLTWGIMVGGEGATGGYRGTLVNGLAGGVLVQFPLPSRHLSVRADLVYHWIGTSGGDKVTAVGGSNNPSCGGGFSCSLSGSYSRIVATSVSLVARLNDPATIWSPYVFGGVAGYLTGNSDEPLYQFHPNHLGFQGGVGFEVRPRAKTIFVEIRYLGVPPGGVVPVVIGMRF